MRPTVAMLFGAPMATALIALAVPAAPALADPPGPVPADTVVFWTEPNFAGIQQSSNATRGSYCNKLSHAAKSVQFADSNPAKLVRLYKTADCADSGVVTTLKPGATWNSTDDTAALGWRVGGGDQAGRGARRGDRGERGVRAGQAGAPRRHGFRHSSGHAQRQR